MVGSTDYYPHFFTATILAWKPLLRQDKYKDVITDSLRFLVQQKRVVVYGSVIMPNHIHLLWHICEGYRREDVQRDFLKYTAQRIKADLLRDHPAVMESFKVGAKDRQYQFWKRNPLSIEITSLASHLAETREGSEQKKQMPDLIIENSRRKKIAV
jgi:REP element-mobilizing transposase RayT